ncbi:unnamed protein product [Caenorhabditis auriculariae]|uniref:non-specific serine/threonine protein kinase n=1 Tax=Caenorhabditis auriculariae TaxID=2777116 RepID=A0A8S1GM77_9PELO|nr:unnamed protein product [Caenorhabditis auriculariae]
MAFNIQTRDRRLAIIGSEDSEITRSSLTRKSSPVLAFFRWIISELLVDGAFIDFLLSTPIEHSSQLCFALQAVSPKKVSVRFVSRFLSPDLAPHNSQIVAIYIDHGKMKASSPDTRASSAQNRYERIRTVGKGAFGSAVLYRRRDDSSLVIIKEINMYDLDSSQRQLALNEVSLLSRIEHPNIIAYYDSFEEEGLLMIEMEYADGGTLAQMLSRSEDLLLEDVVIEMMLQMLSAVGYLHENSVLHRDLKTANIFLTKDAFVKIGDFGISKIMGTDTLAQGAKTVVGTPYYISPEMCSGNTYNEKSDMWALGCILYEMCCLRKAFEGENLPALVNNIMACSYAPIKAPYSSELKVLVRELLQLDPQKRPSAGDALKMLRPSDMRRNKNALRSASTSTKTSSLYFLNTGSIALSPVPRLPSRISIRQVAVSESHTLMLTKDNLLYGWGLNLNGELGLGDTKPRGYPQLIEALKGRDIQSIACGNGFSVVRCDRGTILAFGKGKCLGIGKQVENVLKPTLIEQLLRDNIKEVVCGLEHVIAITEAGECYVWGDGSDGKLGTGNTGTVHSPTKIIIPTPKRVVYGRAGKDATILMTEDGQLIAMGNNRHNKLNLTQRQGFFAKERNENSELVLRPTLVKAFPERVVDLHVGSSHSGVILESGQVMLFGKNENGELGLGNTQPIAVRGLKPVKSLLQHACTQVICGDGFTLVRTTENELFFWGRKHDTGGSEELSQAITIEDLESSQKIRVVENRRNVGTKDKRCQNALEIFNDIIPLPSLILRLQEGSSDKGLRLSGMAAVGKKVLVVVDSTEGKRLPSALTQKTRSLSVTSLAEQSLVRTWLREELNQAEFIPIDSTKRKVRFSGTDEEDPKLSASDSALLKEIENLKIKINEQTTTVEGHQLQMTELQEKLLELQTRQSFLRKAEPPPAYDKRSVPYNRLFPENTSKTCAIL